MFLRCMIIHFSYVCFVSHAISCLLLELEGNLFSVDLEAASAGCLSSLLHITLFQLFRFCLSGAEDDDLC